MMMEMMMRSRNACQPFLLGAAFVWALATAHVGAASGEFPAEQLYEGSAEQKAYSEFNHRLSGMVLLVIGGLFVLKERGTMTRRWLAL